MQEVIYATGVPVQSTLEKVIYTINTTAWTTTPSTPIIDSVKDDLGTTVTSTVMPAGSPSASGAIITLPRLEALTAGRIYTITVTFVSGSNTFATFMRVMGTT